MKKTIFIRNYAEALSSYGQKYNLLEELQVQFKKVMNLLWKESDVRLYFLSPRIEKEEKVALISSCKENLSLDEGFFRFLVLLLKENKFLLLGDIYNRFMLIYEHVRKARTIKVDTAFSLTSAEEEQIIRAFTPFWGKNIILEKSTRPSLIGGIEIFIPSEDVKINLSTRGYLQALRKELYS